MKWGRPKISVRQEKPEVAENGVDDISVGNTVVDSGEQPWRGSDSYVVG